MRCCLIRDAILVLFFSREGGITNDLQKPSDLFDQVT